MAKGKAYHKQVTSPAIEEGNKDYDWWFTRLRKYEPYKEAEERIQLKIIKNPDYLAMVIELQDSSESLKDLGLDNEPWRFHDKDTIMYATGWENKKANKYLKIHKAAEHATQEFIMRNMRLVMKVIRDVSKKKQYDRVIVELIPAGVDGLFVALEKFDISFGVKFSTYATRWVQQKVTRRLVKIASNRIIKKSPLRKEFEDGVKLYRNVFGKKPSEEETFDILGWTEEQRMTFMCKNQDKVKVCIDDETNEKGVDGSGTNANTSLVDVNLIDHDDPLEAMVWKETLDSLEKHFMMLSDIERTIIQLRFGYTCSEIKDMKYNEIEEVIEQPREFIQQIERRALKKLWMFFKISET